MDGVYLNVWGVPNGLGVLIGLGYTLWVGVYLMGWVYFMVWGAPNAWRVLNRLGYT